MNLTEEEEDQLDEAFDFFYGNDYYDGEPDSSKSMVNYFNAVAYTERS